MHSSLTQSALDDIERQHWDAIVVGTGIGGATAGWRLAQLGQRVLFCERGRSTLGSPDAIVGEYPELHAGRPGSVLDRQSSELLIRGGRCIDNVLDQNGRRTTSFVPFVGAGTGGSSSLYGMALERFFDSDFSPRANHPDAVDSSLPETWPIDFASLLPYYSAAEKLYRVRGSADPLRSRRQTADELPAAPSLTPGGEEMLSFLQAAKMNPYRLPMACEFVPGCEGCQGYLCPKKCKNDSARMCLKPAAEQFGATVLDDCEVTQLDADRRRVNKVVCSHGGRTLHLRGAIIVLAAGALQTPNLLLRSSSVDWPRGLANSSDLVGRNLMRHFIDLYIVEPSSPAPHDFDNRFKEIAFNDFYVHEGVKLGTVQSFGRLPPARMLFGSMMQDLQDGPQSWLVPVVSRVRPFLLPFLNRLTTNATALAATLEDLPYLDNRILPLQGAQALAGDVAIRYDLRPEARQRILRSRKLMSDLLRSRKWRRVSQAHNNQRIAHACGTCRFGTDPKSSVLDKNNRAHELDNLYVLDSSFFPSSGGTNPSLTIAANALRVADLLAR